GRKHPHQEFIQIDTSNVLFIVGGAFDGIDQNIKRRLGKKVIGFGGEQEHEEMDTGELLTKVLPEDLLSYDLIPEFIGRLPVIASLKQLDEDPFVDILTKSNSALVNLYEKL